MRWSKRQPEYGLRYRALGHIDDHAHRFDGHAERD
jgi:hypothetical protein